MRLPDPIRAFVAAKNAHDGLAVSKLFLTDGTVEDEGETLRGQEAIRAWSEASTVKYQATYEPTAVVEEGGETVLTALVSGTFDGSPVALDFCFRLEGDRISSLWIP